KALDLPAGHRRPVDEALAHLHRPVHRPLVDAPVAKLEYEVGLAVAGQVGGPAKRKAAEGSVEDVARRPRLHRGSPQRPEPETAVEVLEHEVGLAVAREVRDGADGPAPGRVRIE